MTVTVHHGDSREVLKTMADESIDSVVCDPPYGLNFMGKRWDTGEVAFDPAFWAEVLRVMKPGAHLIAFSGTRTYHRMACAIEDAGFEIRDQIGWLYGSGFPKSHDVSKGIDRANGDDRPVVGDSPFASRKPNGSAGVNSVGLTATPGAKITSAASAAWQGWGTALKPAWEPIVLARKPLDCTVAGNVLRWGTGALNIDASRIATEETIVATRNVALGSFGAGVYGGADRPGVYQHQPGGRWPANVIHDGSEEVVGAFPETGASPSGMITQGGDHFSIGSDAKTRGTKFQGHGDSGSAARFFYSAKADASDRCGSKHPTVKPVDLMAYLVRMVTPPGGVTLDPFAGSGSTGMACLREGFDCILIEREAQYVADIHRRLAHVEGADTPLFLSVMELDL